MNVEYNKNLTPCTTQELIKVSSFYKHREFDFFLGGGGGGGGEISDVSVNCDQMQLSDLGIIC